MKFFYNLVLKIWIDLMFLSWSGNECRV